MAAKDDLRIHQKAIGIQPVSFWPNDANRRLQQVILYLDPVPENWLRGTPEERKQVLEILDRNWRILEAYTFPDRKSAVGLQLGKRGPNLHNQV